MNRLRAAVDQLDLVLCLLWLLPAALLASGAIEVPSAVRVVLAIPFVLALPGYAIVSALLPALELPAVERLLLSIGSSIVLAILLGLVIAGTGDLSPARWAVGITVVTVTGIVAAWVRRVRAGLNGPHARVATMPRLGALAVVLAVLLAANVVAVARLSAAGNDPAAPLQLWLVPDADDPGAALLGVRGGADADEYRLVVLIDDDPIHEFALQVDAGETWQTQLRLSPQQRQQSVFARLFEGDEEVRWVVLRPGNGG